LLATQPNGGLSVPPRKHKCAELSERHGRRVLETGAVKAPKVLKQVNPDLEELNRRGFCHAGRLLFEVLINETGEVECIEIVANDACSKEGIEMVLKALYQWQYSPPLDAKGVPVACYWIVSMNLCA